HKTVRHEARGASCRPWCAGRAPSCSSAGCLAKNRLDRYRIRSHISGGSIREELMPQAKKARAIGFNHIALEVGDIDEALAFYGRLFDFELRGRGEDGAFMHLGAQFVAVERG